jgi:hypothetical protein
MTAQQVGGWTRRVFLRNLTRAGAAGMIAMYPRPVAPIEAPQTRGQADTPSALGGCPQRNAHAHAVCPDCCNYRYDAT